MVLAQACPALYVAGALAPFGPFVALKIAKQAGPGDPVFFQERGDRDTAKVLIPQGAYLARRELVPASRRLFLYYSSTVIRRSLRAGRAGGLMRHCLCYVLVRNCSRGIGQGRGREVLDGGLHQWWEVSRQRSGNDIGYEFSYGCGFEERLLHKHP